MLRQLLFYISYFVNIYTLLIVLQPLEEVFGFALGECFWVLVNLFVASYCIFLFLRL